MKRTLLIFAGALATAAGAARAAEYKTADDLKDMRAKASYSLGMQAANLWKGRGADIDWDAYFQGARDANSNHPLLTDAQSRESLQKFETETRAKYDARMREQGEKNKAAADKFLAENATKAGVQKTASGLQYKVVKTGTGPKPSPSD